MPTKTNSIAKQRTKRTKKQVTQRSNQTGGWFWEESDPITGGLVRGIKSAVSNLKPSQITDFGSNFIPVLGNVSRGLKMVGMGEAYFPTRRGVDPKPDREGVNPKPQRDSVYMGRPETIPRIPIPLDELRAVSDLMKLKRTENEAKSNRIKTNFGRLANGISEVNRLKNKEKFRNELNDRGIQDVITQDGEGRGKRGSRVQRGGSVAQLTPNSNSYGGIKF